MHRHQAQLLAEIPQARDLCSQPSVHDFPLVSRVSSDVLSQIVMLEREPGISFKINPPEEAKIAKQD